MIIMDKKHIILVVVVVAIIAVIGGYFLLNNGTTETITDHSTIVLSKSAYMEVPKQPNASAKADKKGIFYYKDTKEDINITSCSSLSDSSGEKEMKKLKNNITTGSKKLKEDNFVVYEKNGIYSVFVKNTEYNDTLLIQSTDLNLLLQCRESVKYHDPTTKIKFNDTTDSTGSSTVVDAVQQTEKAVEKTTTSTSSSSSSSSSTAGTGTGGYSDFGFGSSSKGSTGSSKASGSSGGGYSDFGFD